MQTVFACVCVCVCVFVCVRVCVWQLYYDRDHPSWHSVQGFSLHFLDRNPSPNSLLPSPPLSFSLVPSCFPFPLSSIRPTFPSPSHPPTSSCFPPTLLIPSIIVPLMYPFHSGFHLALFLFFFPHAHLLLALTFAPTLQLLSSLSLNSGCYHRMFVGNVNFTVLKLWS